MLILASASKARCALLKQLTNDFVVKHANHSEDLPFSEPAEYTHHCAVGKITAMMDSCAPGINQPILSADTVIFCQNRILGKPADSAQAEEFLQMLSGRWFQVYTATAFYGVVNNQPVWQHAMDIAHIRMAEISPAEIARWCQSDDLNQYAGALLVQGPCAAAVRQLKGSYSAVQGLPLKTVAGLLHRCPTAGVRINADFLP